MAGVEVQVGGANLYKRRVITCCSHDNEAAHIDSLAVSIYRGPCSPPGWMENVMRCAELCQPVVCCMECGRIV